MKNQLIFLSALFIVISTSLSAQVRIGGGVSVDVSIDIPIPEIVVVKKRTPKKPRPKVITKQPRKPIIHRCNGHCNHNTNVSYGEIRNQNGPYGLQDYYVQEAQIQPLQNGLENVIYYLDSGDVLELVIATANPQDYNYHIYNNCECSNNNKIVKVLLNSQYLDLRDGSLSLQPKQNGFHSVINLHSMHEGDFNGTINF